MEGFFLVLLFAVGYIVLILVLRSMAYVAGHVDQEKQARTNASQTNRNINNLYIRCSSGANSRRKSLEEYKEEYNSDLKKKFGDRAKMLISDLDWTLLGSGLKNYNKSWRQFGMKGNFVFKISRRKVTVIANNRDRSKIKDRKTQYRIYSKEAHNNCFSYRISSIWYDRPTGSLTIDWDDKTIVIEEDQILGPQTERMVYYF